MRRLAQGSLGVVYEAMDQKLGRRIALKSAPAGYLGPTRAPDSLGRRGQPPQHLHHLRNPHRRIRRRSRRLCHHGAGRGTHPRRPSPHRQIARARGPRHRLPTLRRARRGPSPPGDSRRPRTLQHHPRPNPRPTGPRAVITDFGLARGARQAGATRGTPDYMAPELSTGASPTVASDIYALGVILQELAAGLGPGQAAAPPASGALWVPAGTPSSSVASPPILPFAISPLTRSPRLLARPSSGAASCLPPAVSFWPPWRLSAPIGTPPPLRKPSPSASSPSRLLPISPIPPPRSIGISMTSSRASPTAAASAFSVVHPGRFARRHPSSRRLPHPGPREFHAER